MKRELFLLCLCPVALLLPGCAASSDAAGDGGNIGFGGAQDIGQFRGILEDGDIPGEQTLDANGFFNEHYTELPAADCGQTVCLQGMLSVARDWLAGDYQATLQLAMNTPLSPEDAERKPLNLVVVVDTSGSMAQDDRMSFARDGLHLLIDTLEDTDRLALVSYSSSVAVHNGLSGPLDREFLHAQVANLRAGGSTNFHGGLQSGFDLALQALDFERQNRVIMVSDGLPTAGVTDDGSIIEMSVDYISQRVGLTTIGVCRDFNVELMRGLAERGAGNFYFLEDASAIEEVFVEEVDYFVEPIALGLDLSVAASDGYQLGEVTGTRLWKTGSAGGSMFVPAAFLASRTSNEPGTGRRGGGSTIFIDLVPVAGAELPEVATVTLSYRLPEGGDRIEQTIVVENPAAPGEILPEDYYSHTAVAENHAMYNMFLGLREATRSAQYDYHCAMSQLERLDQEAARWNLEFADEDISADRELVAQFVENLRRFGALTPEELGFDACEGYADGQYRDDYHFRACSVSTDSGDSGPLWLLFLGALLMYRRRRQA